MLQVRGLNVFYGASHALQGVDLTLHRGALSVVGRNGMGKTTLCNAIMGLLPLTSGEIVALGQSVGGWAPAEIARIGIGYVPQGRRLWPSLTVDEHLRMTGVVADGSWSIDRIYTTFPRLAERRGHGAGQLSGGEQQMLAISRALLLNPHLLVMDEPTEGLAPVIVARVSDILNRLVDEEDVNILVIEQNIGVATEVSDRVAIMVNGRITRIMDSRQLARDRALQHALLGVGRHAEEPEPDDGPAAGPDPVATDTAPPRIYVSNPHPPTRWSRPAAVHAIEKAARFETAGLPRVQAEVRVPAPGAAVRSEERFVIVAGTFDTKGDELRFMRDILASHGLEVRTVDLSTAGRPSGADVPPHQVAAHHPRGAGGVFTRDRGSAVAAMTHAFERWISREPGIAGALSAGGSGGTAMASPAFRSLPVGVPKLIVSTVASGDVARYVGASDLILMPAVADIQGLNSITRHILANGAHALAGMVEARRKTRSGAAAAEGSAGAVGITMFGVTTQCVRQVVAALETDHECLVFHATGTGGQAMERLAEGGLLSGVIDITTTEVCDMMMGGIFPASEDRFGAVIRSGMPYIGSCGALDMVNFGPPDTVPEQYRGRTLYQHNPQVTLMRTNADENRRMGRWIGERLNLMDGPVRFFLPEGGVSELDAPDRPFHDPAADTALFEALEQTVRRTATREVIRVPCNINDREFTAEIVAGFRDLHGLERTGSGRREGSQGGSQGGRRS